MITISAPLQVVLVSERTHVFFSTVEADELGGVAGKVDLARSSDGRGVDDITRGFDPDRVKSTVLEVVLPLLEGQH
jgi:hypothetical protein